MVATKLLSQADLAKTQTFCIYEFSKVIVVSENENLVFANFQIMPPCFEGFNNGQKLTVVSFVSSFSNDHFTQDVGHWMPLAQVIGQLTQHSTNSIPRRVSFNPDILFRIKVLKDRRFSKGLT